jgi:homoserine dehydrogenase
VVQASARDLAKPRICATGGIELTTDPYAVVNNPGIDIVVELIGGRDVALDLVLKAIDNGKHVVTANKALIAHCGNEIFQAAHEKGVVVAFEAAVAGGIPIIKAIREGLAGNRVEWLAGIINGTGNFILTAMSDEGRDFDDVLADAQRLGYAEADPTFDVDGIDAAHKLTILASIAFGIPLQFDKVYTEGIARVTPEDIGYADRLGYRIKHLGIARRAASGIEMRVHPTLIPQRRLIANVNGVMNAVLVRGDAIGSSLYYGAGAGAEPTASAVVADLVDVVRALTTDPGNRVPHLAFQPDAISDEAVLDMEDAETAYYLRMDAADRPGVLAEIATVLGNAGISIEAVVQPEPPRGAERAKLILLTHRVLERQMNAALAKVATLDVISGAVTRIRVEHLDGD